MPSSSLKILRIVHDYTQEYVAETVLGIRQTNYHRLEKDPARVTSEQARKLAALYKVDASELIKGSEVVLVFPDGHYYTIENGMNHGDEVSSYQFAYAEEKLLLEERCFLRRQNTELLELMRLLCEQKSNQRGNDHFQKSNSHAMEQ